MRSLFFFSILSLFILASQAMAGKPHLLAVNSDLNSRLNKAFESDCARFLSVPTVAPKAEIWHQVVISDGRKIDRNYYLIRQPFLLPGVQGEGLFVGGYINAKGKAVHGFLYESKEGYIYFLYPEVLVSVRDESPNFTVTKALMLKMRRQFPEAEFSDAQSGPIFLFKAPTLILYKAILNVLSHLSLVDALELNHENFIVPYQFEKAVRVYP